jgi:hypothetical protein
MTPLARYQQDLAKIRTLGPRAAMLDALFLHRVRRLVRKDGTVSYQGTRFEVPFELSGQTVRLVVDPHAEVVVGVENEKGESIGLATPLDALANLDRRRRKPDSVNVAAPSALSTGQRAGPNLVELAYQQYHHPVGE